jgi:hypothetical protein
VAVLGEDVVQRADQVGRSVDQGPVEVEGDDGAGEVAWTGFRGSGQGMLSGRLSASFRLNPRR